MIAGHAQMARTLGAELALPAGVPEALGSSYERWDGRGRPGEVGGEDVPVASRLAQAAEFFEVANRVGGPEGAPELARERRGTQFDPAVCQAVEADAEAILSALLAVANFVDLKSPDFLGHAKAVSDVADPAIQSLA